jgi:hypothetical protein
MANEWDVVSKTPAADDWSVVSSAPSRQTPSYDPMGGFTGYTEDAVQSTMPYGEQMSNVGAALRTGARGAAEGFFGQVGDLALMARRHDPFTLAGLMPKIPVEDRPFGRELGLFPAPTTEEIGKGTDWAFGEPEENKKLFRTAGQVLGPFASPTAIGRLGQKAADALIGRPNPGGAKVAAEAEAEGLSVRAGQIRGKKPSGEPLSLKEQEKINEEVSAVTGASTKSVDAEFIDGRLKALGKDYDIIYSGEFQIGEDVANAAKAIMEQEAAIGAAGDAGVQSIARNIFSRWNKAREDAEALAQQQQIMSTIRGQQTALKRGTGAPAGSGGEVVMRKFGPGERIDAAPLTDDLLKLYKAGDHTNVRPITAADAPAWAKDVHAVITDLTEQLGLRVRPGVYVGNGRGSYGWAHPYGHIFLNESSLKNPADALATALHEFGHMVEFQLFGQAPTAVKQAINDAWAASKIEGAGKTVEQLRPVSASKYGPDHAAMVPTSAKDKSYYLGFSEWYAEQVSRWLTTAKEPVTVAEKFFKGIADTWKKIYQKVTGYLPMAKATDDFMRLNWNGKLINDEAVLRIFQAKEIPPAGATPAGAAAAPISGGAETAKSVALAKPVIAKIEGKDLQRLRSYIADRSVHSSDGMVRTQARRTLKQIDDAIEMTNPAKKALLQKTNTKYRATLTLKDLLESNDISLSRGSNISPQTLGRAVQASGYELTHPLAKWARYGNKLGMRSATQGAEYTRDPISNLLTRSGRLVRYLNPLDPVWKAAQRNIQRKMTPGAPPPVKPGYVVPTGGASVRAFQPEEE